MVEVGQHGVDDVLADVRSQLCYQVDAFGVLGGQHDGVQPDRRGAGVLNGDLGLAVGSQIIQPAALAGLSQPPRQPVRQRDRKRHQFGGVANGVAEHQALIAGALRIEGVGGTLDSSLVRRVHTLTDIRRLAADADVHSAGGSVKTLLRRVVADFQDPRAHRVGDIGEGFLCRGGDFTHDMHLTGGDQGLDRDP